MLLDFCNAIYNESSTLTKSSKNDAGVFCNSPWYSNETRRRQSKSVFVDNFVKTISDAKSFTWNLFGNLVNKVDGTVKDVNSVYCNNCLWSSEIGPKSVQKHCQHEKFVTTFWMFGKNAGNFQYSVRPCQHWDNWKHGNGKREMTLENPKPTRITEFNIKQKHMTHTSGPSKPKTINSALRYQRCYVIHF